MSELFSGLEGDHYSGVDKEVKHIHDLEICAQKLEIYFRNQLHTEIQNGDNEMS